MWTSLLLPALGFAGLVVAGPCPFHHLRDAAAAGQLQGREAKIVDKMARDPTYIPALDPEALALMKREAAPELKANVPNPVEERGLLPSILPLPTILPIIGGGLCTFNLTLYLVQPTLTCVYLFQ